MHKLDERDIQILVILQEEGRITKTALAEKLNLSLTPSWDRLQRLEEAGIIESYGARLSSSFLDNFHLVITEVELESHKQGQFARFEEAILGFDEVLSCWSVGGGLDYILKVLVKDVNDYQEFIKRVLKADIGMRRYFSYAVLNKIKDTDVIPEGLIKKSDLVKRNLT
ncbi:MAG: Lrp/AsnC family transcriptional regulator [Gammaproteobacteria bacterium]|jgi:Lrp/AsnC family transcriptional regulator of ectoine degradation|nr:Lrp/AsnC family transcriptional regulator [Gammaproteobacteria bacterium]MBT6141545.1 Lrp/AsnC family transcriptional regulator [Gammaproteobacteria bacterium]MBT6633956.1 Lrp/AsnC family transcriptional regulator [Gammaproteobacteria bacterium]